MSTATVMHLGSISIDAIAKIRPMDSTGLCDELRERGEIQAFVTRYGNVLMTPCHEGKYLHNAERHSKFTSIIVVPKQWTY